MADLGAIGFSDPLGEGGAATPAGGAIGIEATRVVLSIGTWLDVLSPGQLLSSFPAYAILLFQGLTEKPDSAVNRTETESGPPKQLKKVSRVLVKRAVSYLLVSKTDKDSFTTWFNVTVNRGADWFNWLDPYDGMVKSARIVGGEIDPKPQRKSLDRWIVSFQIETWNG